MFPQQLQDPPGISCASGSVCSVLKKHELSLWAKASCLMPCLSLLVNLWGCPSFEVEIVWDCAFWSIFADLRMLKCRAPKYDSSQFVVLHGAASSFHPRPPYNCSIRGNAESQSQCLKLKPWSLTVNKKHESHLDSQDWKHLKAISSWQFLGWIVSWGCKWCVFENRNWQFSRRATACSDSPDSEAFVSTPFARPGTSIFARRPS